MASNVFVRFTITVTAMRELTEQEIMSEEADNATEALRARLDNVAAEHAAKFPWPVSITVAD